MFHLLGFTIASSSTTANSQMPALTDDIFTIQNGNFLPQSDVDGIFASAFGATVTESRLVTPSLRQVTPPSIFPIPSSLLPVSNFPTPDYRANPIRLKALEEIELQYTDTGGTVPAVGLLGVQQGFRPTPGGTIYTLRGVSVTAAVARTWTSLTTTWNDSLPNGRYIVVGLQVAATNQIAARILFEEQAWRPGCVASVTVNSPADKMFRHGGLGIWGEFRNTAMPTIQVLNNGTDNAHTIFMDIMRIGAN